MGEVIFCEVGVATTIGRKTGSTSLLAESDEMALTSSFIRKMGDDVELVSDSLAWLT